LAYVLPKMGPVEFGPPNSENYRLIEAPLITSGKRFDKSSITQPRIVRSRLNLVGRCTMGTPIFYLTWLRRTWKLRNCRIS